MKQIKFILLLISIVSFNITEAQVKEPMLHYLIRDAKIKQSKPPVIILLHGYGSNEQDLFAFANQLPDSFLVISAQAPNKLGNDSYAWYPLDFSTGKLAYKKEEAEKSRLHLRARPTAIAGRLSTEHPSVVFPQVSAGHPGFRARCAYDVDGQSNGQCGGAAQNIENQLQ